MMTITKMMITRTPMMTPIRLRFMTTVLSSSLRDPVGGHRRGERLFTT
jgi:hypothetical protein